MTETLIYVKPGQKSVTIKCPICDFKVVKVSSKAGVADCTDFSTCDNCGHQFGWRTEARKPVAHIRCKSSRRIAGAK